MTLTLTSVRRQRNTGHLAGTLTPAQVCAGGVVTVCPSTASAHTLGHRLTLMGLCCPQHRDAHAVHSTDTGVSGTRHPAESASHTRARRRPQPCMGPRAPSARCLPDSPRRHLSTPRELSKPQLSSGGPGLPAAPADTHTHTQSCVRAQTLPHAPAHTHRDLPST